MKRLHDLGNGMRSRRGASLIYAILVVGGMAMMTMYVLDAQRQNRVLLADKRIGLELRVLLEDVKEVGKYLLFYEKTFYSKRPLISDDALKKTWELAFASYGGVCGYMNKLGKMGGAVDKDIICAARLRDGSSSDRWLEETILPYYTSGMLTKKGKGQYEFSLELGEETDDGLFNPSYFINLSNSSKLRSAAFRENYKLTAKIIYRFKTQDYGIRFANTAERLVDITAELYLKQKSKGFIENIFMRFGEKKYTTTESISLVASNPRIFAIFAPYPKGALNSSGTLDPEKEASYDLDFKLGKGSTIHGKVFFNGGIFKGQDGTGKGVNWMRLIEDGFPRYLDSFVLSKEWGGPKGGYVVPGHRELQYLEKHFVKGVVSNLNAPRFILNGYHVGGAVIDNYASMYSVKRGTQDLVDLMFPKPKANPVIRTDYLANNSGLGYEGGPCYPGHDLNCFQKDKDPWRFISPAFPSLTIAGGIQFIQAVVQRLRFAANTNIYGVVMPEQISSNEGADVTWYSLYNMAAGLPGIGGEDDFTEANGAAFEGLAYLSFPLTNFPSVYSPKQGFH